MRNTNGLNRDDQKLETEVRKSEKMVFMKLLKTDQLKKRKMLSHQPKIHLNGLYYHIMNVNTNDRDFNTNWIVL